MKQEEQVWNRFACSEFGNDSLINKYIRPKGVWYVGVDSGWGYRVFSSVCSLLGDVCCHFVLGSDHLPVYNVPHWSPQQDTTGPLDYTGSVLELQCYSSVSGAVDFLSVNQAVRGRHNYNCWEHLQ
ncbi:hypothetical protein CgunFtcFv8_019905 [Champsocephalus gunnari]|uniref:Uncharacterized protein n=1 Tax=Champsocephalus gunnari TaxID=52237 RepID=A0AAN8DR25_CHAGU|nr:hypothetical protein CgunFtcFv8_019905 [Champsocephalus gunnari]